MAASELPLAGRTIGITADRRWSEQAELFRRRGAEVIHGPTMATIDLSREERLREVTLELVERPPDYLVVTTGMGLRRWMEAAQGWGLDADLKAALAASTILARGAKSASAVRGMGLDLAWRAPGETMDEVVDHLATRVEPRLEPRVEQRSPRVALQLFDTDGHPSTAALASQAAELVEVPVYQWRLPADTGPARALVEATVAGRLDAVTFTSQPAVRFLLRIAAGLGRADDLRSALNGGVLPACIGPVCAEAAREEGIERPLWPEPPRLPSMVRQVTEHLGPLPADT